MIEQALSIAIGTVLIGAVCFLMMNPSRSAKIIEDYYARQVATETAEGWLGRPLLTPGRRGSLIMLFVLAGSMLAIGIFAIYAGVMA